MPDATQEGRGERRPAGGGAPLAWKGGTDFGERPYVVVYEVTRACVLACRHCRAEADPHAHPDELSTLESIAFLDQVARAGPALFILTGGDPAMRVDLPVLIREAAARGLRVALSPSATPRLLRADFGELVRSGVARISLSLDGATRDAHDAFRGVRGAWDWTMAAVERSRAAGLPFQVNTTLTAGNIGEFGAFAALLERLRPVLWSLFLLVPTGRASLADLPDARAVEDLFVKLYEHSRAAPYDVKTTEGYHYRRVVAQRSRGTNALRGRAPLGISDGKGFVFVSHTGEVCPSGFLPLVAGNVRRHELIDIYRDAPLFRALRDPDRFHGKCGQCEYRRLCGGSRARAHAVSGDPLGEEPLCAYEPRGPGADAPAGAAAEPGAAVRGEDQTPG